MKKVFKIVKRVVGLSEDSKIQRTSEVVVEIRSTLKQLGIKPPYVLVPHYSSGVYSMEYMNLYPEEIEVIVGIDFSVTQQVKYDGDFPWTA